MNFKNNLFFMLIGISCLNDAQSLTVDYFLLNETGFFTYLANLASQMRWPTGLIKAGAHAQGYSQEEVDGIPASYPLICEGRYKQLGNVFSDSQTVALANKLLDMYDQETIRTSDKTKKRKKLHQLIHKLNLEELGLNPSMSTKQFADLVKKRQVDISKLCRLQIAMFFIKYYLGL